MQFKDRQSALLWATARCARRECCRFDIESKLREANLPRRDIEAVLDYLEDHNYLSAQRYANAFVHDKHCFAAWGRIKIQQALAAKRIARPIIAEAIAAQIEPQTYAQQLRQILATKLRQLDFDPTDRQEAAKATQKLLRFAASRGYEAELIFDTIDKLRSQSHQPD